MTICRSLTDYVFYIQVQTIVLAIKGCADRRALTNSLSLSLYIYIYIAYSPFSVDLSVKQMGNDI